MDAADGDDLVAAQCWMEARGLDYHGASLAALVGAIREVRAQRALTGLQGLLGKKRK